MIGIDQDIHDFPPWVWPYIRFMRADPGNIIGPVPDPWRFIGNVVSVLGVKAAVRVMRDEAAQKRLGRSFDSKLNALLEEYCGTVPRPLPHPWPGPHPHVYTTAAQLALLAHSLPAGEMRDDVLGVSADLVQRAEELQQAASG